MAEEPATGLTAEQLKQIYASSFGYYLTLSEEYKNLFVARCRRFISEKTITGAGGFKVTSEVRALVAASAVQLTLGLETWELSYFDNIVLYPSVFASPAGNLQFKGETNTAGYIKLSWQSFIQGYHIADDNLNLGLHEFSHALRFNDIKGSGQDYFFEHYFNSWLASAYEAYNDIRNGRSTVFRKYGGANLSEFTSVCIEHFFESPEEIRARYPLLYYSTAVLLNQETVGQRTHVGVRHQLLGTKNQLLPGFRPRTFSTSLSQSNALIFAAIPFLLWVIILFSGQFLSLPALLFMSLWLGLYLRCDYRYTQLELQNKTVLIKKGLFVFRGLKVWQLPIAALISFRAENVKHLTMWKVVLYNTNNSFFYEETVYAPATESAGFMKELSENKIARFK